MLLQIGCRWAELETGATTLAFTPLEQREAAITGGIHAPGADEQRSNVEVCFTFKDVDAAFKVGGTSVSHRNPLPHGFCS